MQVSVVAAGNAKTAREKAETLRKIFAKIVLHDRHYDHQPAKGSKRTTWPRSSVDKIEFVPWMGGTEVIPVERSTKPS